MKSKEPASVFTRTLVQDTFVTDRVLSLRYSLRIVLIGSYVVGSLLRTRTGYAKNSDKLSILLDAGSPALISSLSSGKCIFQIIYAENSHIKT